MRRTNLVLLVVGVVTIAGCSTPAGPAPTPTPTPTPLDIASAAGEQMLSTQSVHFIIEISGQLVYLDDPPTIALKRAEGDLQRPDRVRAIVRISSFGVISELGIIGLGSEQYVTNPLNQQWELLPPGYGWYFDPTLLFDPEYGIEAVLREATWAFGVGEDIEGQPHYLLQGQLPGERLSRLTSWLIRDGTAEVSVWVGQQDQYVRRIQIVEPESDPEGPTTWLIAFSALDKPVEIEAPPIP